MPAGSVYHPLSLPFTSLFRVGKESRVMSPFTSHVAAGQGKEVAARSATRLLTLPLSSDADSDADSDANSNADGGSESLRVRTLNSEADRGRVDDEVDRGRVAVKQIGGGWRAGRR